MRARKRKRENGVKATLREKKPSVKGTLEERDKSSLSAEETARALSLLKDSPGARNETELTEAITRLQRQYGNASLLRMMEEDRGSERGKNQEPDQRGEALNSGLRQEMEAIFGRDLNGVRIHRDRKAEESAKAMNAAAYARGKDIYFGKNRFEPQTRKGKELLTHELTHVLQQGSKKPSSQVGAARSALEREAVEAVQMVRRGVRPTVKHHGEAQAVLRQEEEKKEPARFKKHPREIIPALKKGVINAGPFSITFTYEVSEGAEVTTLVLHVPDEVGVSFNPLGGASEAGYRISDPGGTKARTILIAVSMGGKKTPKMRALFTKGGLTYTVIFQFAQ